MRKNWILFIGFICLSTLYSTTKVVSYGECYASFMECREPASISEVQDIVKEAMNQGKKVCIKGAGLSQGQQYQFADAIMIDMKNMKAMQLDGEVLFVQAGALWKDVHSFINDKGLALAVMQGSNIFSVGGSLSVNCHGWDFHQGSIANTVSEITVVDAHGDVRKLYPEDHLFSYVIGGYGCFGVIVEAKIHLTKNHRLEEVSKKIKVKEYIDHFKKRVHENPEILMHRYRLSLDPKSFFSYGIATDYKKLGEESVVSDISENNVLENMIRAGFWLERKAPFFKQLLWKFTKSYILKKRTTSRNEVMTPPTKFHFDKHEGYADWLQEFFVKEDELADFIDYLGGVLKKNNVKLANATIRYVKEQKNVGLAYSPNDDRFAVVLFFRQSLKPHRMQRTESWVKEVINYVLAHDGTYYLPYQHFALQEQFEKSYPDWKSFKQEKEQHDPDCLFYNGMYARYFMDV